MYMYKTQDIPQDYTSVYIYGVHKTHILNQGHKLITFYF